MSRDGLAKAREIAAWKEKVRRGWAGVRVESVVEARSGAHRVGEGFDLAATVRLGDVSPEDVAVEAYYGPLDATRDVRRGETVPLALESSLGGGVHRYGGTIPCERSGMQGYSVRVRPSHPEACDLLGTGLVAWWQG
jgi:starch phosphorylase